MSVRDFMERDNVHDWSELNIASYLDAWFEDGIAKICSCLTSFLLLLRN